jgi:hypothetical protein
MIKVYSNLLMYVICAYHKCVAYVISIIIIIVALKCSLYKNVDF